MFGSLCLLILIGIAYWDSDSGSMGWGIALPGFLLLGATLVAFIVSIILFFTSLSKEEPLDIIKNKIWYWMVVIFIIIFVLFVNVMQATGNG